MRHVVVAGATGLVGSHILRLLADRDDVSITALTRSRGRLAFSAPNLKESAFDYADPNSYARIGSEIPCDVLFCALGTTIKTAGSADAFAAVDRDFPLALFQRLKDLKSKPIVGVVSSIGADRPSNFYLKVNKEMEDGLRATALPHVIARPSFLLGERAEVRFVERLGIALLGKPMSWLKSAFPKSEGLARFAPIEAECVAEALIRTCLDGTPPPSGLIIEGLALHGGT